MNKSLEALIRGYVVFMVNRNRYWTYSAARSACNAIPDDQDIRFFGFSMWRWKWLCFRNRCVLNERLKELLAQATRVAATRATGVGHNADAEE